MNTPNSRKKKKCIQLLRKHSLNRVIQKLKTIPKTIKELIFVFKKDNEIVLVDAKCTRRERVNRTFSEAISQILDYLKAYRQIPSRKGVVIMDVPVSGLGLKYLGYLYPYKKKVPYKLGAGFFMRDKIIMTFTKSWVKNYEVIPLAKAIEVESIELTPIQLFDFVFYHLWLQHKREWEKLEVLTKAFGLVKILDKERIRRGYILTLDEVIKEPWAMNKK